MSAVTPAPSGDWLLESALAPVVAGDVGDVLAPFYDAAAHGELAMPFCAECDQPLEMEQRVCDGCGAAHARWCAVEPSGSVHAATVMHRLEPGLVRADAPYPIVDVELHSGHRLVMTTVHPSSTAPPIGAPVRIGFRRLGDIALPAIESVEESQ